MDYIEYFLKKLLAVISIIENIICGVGFWLTTFLIFFAIINRYYLHFPIVSLSDLGLYCFIFFVLFVIALTTREKGNISVNIFREKITKGNLRAESIYSVFLDVISIFVLLVLLPLIWQFMLNAIKFPKYSALARWFNESWLVIVFFISSILVIIHLFIFLIKDVKKLKQLKNQ